MRGGKEVGRDRSFAGRLRVVYGSLTGRSCPEGYFYGYMLYWKKFVVFGFFYFSISYDKKIFMLQIYTEISIIFQTHCATL